MNKKRVVIVGLTILFSILLYFVFFIALPRSGKIAVEVLMSPDDAQLYINSNPVSSKKLYLKPDTYMFIAKREGWKDTTVSAAISKNINTIALVLEPNSSEAQNYLEDSEVSNKREGLAGVAANTRGLTIRNTHPILDKLPYSDVAGPFKIDFGFNKDDDKTPYLIVSFSTPNGRQRAINWLKSKDVNITDIEIIYSDFVSPVSKERGHHD